MNYDVPIKSVLVFSLYNTSTFVFASVGIEITVSEERKGLTTVWIYVII